MSVARACFTCFLLLMLAACGGGSGGEDAGALDGAADGGLVAPPAIPWLEDPGVPVALTPCPEGWREVVDADVTTCDPHPEGGHLACPRGEAHFAGEASCAPVGDLCPTGDFATTLPTTGTVLYVLAGAPAGGDGSLASPYAELSEVRWTSLAPGTTVALGKGTYEGALQLRAGVHVVGACAAETRLTGVAAPVLAVVSVTTTGEPAVLRNVSISDAPQIGALVQAGRQLALEGVLVEGNAGFGIVAAETGTTVTLSEVVVTGTHAGSSGTVGRGIEVQLGARLEATRVLVEGNRELGIFAGSPGSELVLRDAVVRATEGREADGGGGSGIAVELGARLEAERVLVEQNLDLGMLVSQEGTVAVLTDVVVRDTESEEAGLYGRGIVAQMGARLEATRLLLERNREVGLWAGDAPTEVVVSDVVVRDVRGRAIDEEGGRGITAAFGARVEATRIVIERSHEIGLEAHSGAAVSITDAVVRDTDVGQSSGDNGMGVHVQLGAQLDASRVLVERSHDVGIFAGTADTAIDLTDVIVRDTRALPSAGTGGRGVSAQEGARIVATRTLVEGARGAGASAIGGGTVEMSHARITGVDVSECAATTCAGVPLGYGVVGLEGSLRLDHFEVSAIASCGVMVAGAPATTSVDLAHGVVTGTSIGACVQIDGYDLSRLSNDVQYRDNGVNLDSTSLPVPEPTAPLDPLGR